MEVTGHNNSQREAQRRIPIFEGDRTLWIIYAVLIVISVLVVYSSTAKMVYDISSSLTTTESLRQQLMLIMVMSLPMIFIAHKVNYTFYQRITKILFWLFVLLTLATYVVGSTTNGAARWLPIGPFKFQPSEILKIATIMMLARCMEDRQSTIHNIKLLPTSFKLRSAEQKRILRENTWPILGPVIVACGVIAPAHISSAAIIGIASLLMLYIGRVPKREILKILVVGASVAIIGFTLLSLVGIGRGSVGFTRLTRWITELTTDGNRSYVYELSDTERAMIAIHNGGLMGEGAGHSTSRAVVIHPESDYAYAFFASEYGVIAALVLMLLYLWITFRSIEICRRCTTPYPTLLAAGLGLLITCQAMLHIMVQVNLLPETGQTLPLISRGGSSLMSMSIALGMIISISRAPNLTTKR
ncbi:MAG: FtsW/RodA/SpoVE family cell cycle protein [Rikenellaceae bacterium]|nr:FtsW/RodA/SpoVE family cell cycle protein [Rikenellaceae bacterium]